MADDIVLDDNAPLQPVFMGGQAPEAVHGGWFKPAGPWGEEAVLKRASEVAATTRDRLNAAHEMRVNPDPSATSAANDQKLRRAIDEIGRGWASSWQDVRGELKRRFASVEAELTAAANLKVNPDFRNAILGTFTGMKPEERWTAIQQAIAEGDGPTVATLLAAPAMVTGLNGEQRATIKAQLFERTNPAQHSLLKELAKAQARAEAASLACIDAQSKLLLGTDRHDAKVKRARELEQQLTVH